MSFLPNRSRRDPGKRLARAISAGGAVMLISIAILHVRLLDAQQAAAPQAVNGPPPTFDVVSIKRDTSNTNFIGIGGQSVDRWTGMNVSAKILIEVAYNVKDFQISGGPSWIDSEKFDVEAKVDDSVVEQLQKLPRMEQEQQKALMLRPMLADRFKLEVSHASKDLPVYALVVAKGGPKLQEVPPPDPQSGPAPAPPTSPGGGPSSIPPGGMRMSMNPGGQASLTVHAARIANLANMLSRQLGRIVLDQTGLKGTYDYTLQFTSEAGLGGGPLPPGGGDPNSNADTGGTSIYTALQEQLGLRLETTKAPVDTITIDHIEEPSEN